MTLYLVVAPSDISRTKPLVRLILDQIGRRLTEDLQQAKGRRRRLLLMLDEFPALGRLDFFESALAFMAGYGLKSFLIAQSLNQIEKAYGPNNAMLDNCHVRVSFATNDERTAKRVSDALGTATEMRALRNYAGHRLSPWLGHLMVSRQETARPLLTPGEVMQLPPGDELVLVSGVPPIRAKKARYFEDPRLTERILAPPAAREQNGAHPPDDWSGLPAPAVGAGPEAYLSGKERSDDPTPKYGAAGGRPQVVWSNGVLASLAVGLVVQMVTPWSRRAKRGAYLSYDGNSGLVTEAERFRRWSASCTHYPNAAVGDMTFDIRKFMASDRRGNQWVERIMRSVRKWTSTVI